MAAVESARALAEHLSSNDLGCPADAYELEFAIEARDKAVAIAVLDYMKREVVQNETWTMLQLISATRHAVERGELP